MTTSNSSLAAPSSAEYLRLVQCWEQINQQIAVACEQAGRKPDAVSLLAVSKTKPAHMIATLAQAGQRHFGENYLQEALTKIHELAELDICWHYIGHIQRNKTRDIAENFAWVHTLERAIIAKRLHQQRPAHLPALNVLIQVNIDDEDSKSGCQPDEVADLMAQISQYDRLRLRGLMIIPANSAVGSSIESNSRAFIRTQQLFTNLAEQHPEIKDWDTLSMGMSNDMAAAIAHGATIVRVGTALFGKRDSSVTQT